jgi:uncharacterized protein
VCRIMSYTFMATREARQPDSWVQWSKPDKGRAMSNSEANKRIDYIEFPATDAAAAKQFYGEVFGWKFEDYGPHYAAFSDGRLSGGFQASADDRPAKPLVVIYASDLATTLSSVHAAGGKITREIFSFPGGRRFHFTDPNGNELAVWSE